MTDLCFVEDFGAKGDGINDDRASFQTALNSEQLVFMRNRPYIIDGSLEYHRFQTLRGFASANGESYSVLPIATSSPKLLFVGRGTAAIKSANSLDLMSHGSLSNFTMHVSGIYDAMIDLPDCVKMSFENLVMQTDNINTRGFKSHKVNHADNWRNYVRNVSIRLPDASSCVVFDEAWSDSEVYSGQFTGGGGTVSRGYGTKYFGTQFERSKGAGVNIWKTTNPKYTAFTSCQFDANAQFGASISVEADNSSTGELDVMFINPIFRTCDPNTSQPGIANIQYTGAKPHSVYNGYKPIGLINLNRSVMNLQYDPARFILV